MRQDPLKSQWWALPSLVGFLLLSASAQGATNLTYWRFNAKQSRLEIITDAGVKPKAQLIGSPTRLVVDLPNVSFGKPTANKAIGSYVTEVRVGQFSKWTTRMVVELGPKYTLRPNEIKVRSLAPNRWFVQLPKLQPRSKLLPIPKNGIAVKVPPAKSYPKARVVSGATRVVIYVDPGHGGVDPGAVGRGGIQEKWIVLDIAKEVAKLLEQRGIQTVLARASDWEPSLEARVAQSESVNASAFISIHANSISLSRPDINGLETYYYASGYRLAKTIHSSILRQVNVRDRGVRKARFYVLRKTSMPAVLIETGFVTGAEDAARLSSNAQRSKIAQAIADGIVQYFR